MATTSDDRERARWQRIDRILDQAFDRSAADQAAFLDQACGTDMALRREVESLLRADAGSKSFLEHRTEELQTGLGVRSTEVGLRLGAYRLTRKIGEGGMGTVYLATREDSQFQQQVAIKVLRGGARDDLHQRFRIERQTLARLEHAHIARLYDGGVTEDGRPYLVMEYIDGLPLDRYCDQNDLTIDRRLALFCIVCDAVSHAHRNLLVHRDLKPGNILVSTNGEPKLLDFGIAKLLDTDLSAETALVTRTGMRPMSLAYASPEQVRGDAITTASDVYSLGVVLFDLLTGRHPYHPGTDSPHELEQAIIEQAAPPPSTVITRPPTFNDDRGARSPATLAQTRGITPNELRTRLRGDLDTIVGKALRKEPERRYGSARDLADDLRRHLEHRPVSARPDTLRYRLGKLVRRNPVASVAWATALLLLIGIALVASAMAFRVARERDFADQERAKAQASSGFLTELLEGADPTNPAGPNLTVREILDRGAKRIESLSDQPELQATHMTTIGRGYRNLGLYDVAAPLLAQATALRRRLHGDGSVEVAASLNELASLRQDQGHYGLAEPFFREALAIRRQQLGNRHEDVAESLNNLALLLYLQDDFEGAEPLYRECLTIIQEISDEHPGILSVLGNLGMVVHARGDYESAEPLYREVLTQRREQLGDEHVIVAQAMNNLGTLYRDRGELAMAEPILTQALAMRQRLLGSAHPAVAHSLRNLALLRFEQGDLIASEHLYRQGLDIARAIDDGHPLVARMLTGVARSMLAQGQVDEAEMLIRQSLEIFTATLPTDHWRIAYAQAVLGACLSRRGQIPDAERLLVTAFPRIRARLSDREPRTRDALRLVFEHFERHGLVEKAAAFRADADRTAVH